MSSFKPADISISIPDGTFRGAIVRLNGVDISHQVNALSFEASADEPFVFVNLKLIAKVYLTGIAKTDVEWYEPT